MKKKALGLVLASLLVCALAMGLVACNKDAELAPITFSGYNMSVTLDNGEITIGGKKAKFTQSGDIITVKKTSDQYKIFDQSKIIVKYSAGTEYKYVVGAIDSDDYKASERYGAIKEDFYLLNGAGAATEKLSLRADLSYTFNTLGANGTVTSTKDGKYTSNGGIFIFEDIQRMIYIDEGNNVWSNVAVTKMANYQGMPTLTKIANAADEDSKSIIGYTLNPEGTYYSASFMYDSNGGTALSPATVKINDMVLGLPVTNIAGTLFDRCDKKVLTSVTLPNKLITISDGAFSGCAAVKGITIPDTVTLIGANAFNGCEKISQVIFSTSSSLAKIGNGAFSGCSGMSAFTVPATVKQIDSNAFKGCSALGSFEIGAAVTSLGSNAFNGCISITKFTFASESALTEISDFLFAKCNLLTEIAIPKNVTSIGKQSFSGCPLLAKVTLPTGLKTIGSSAFASCIAITSFELPEGIESLEVGAFQDCKGLAAITIPNSLKEIGSSAFKGCIALKNVTIPTTLEKIGSSAFSNCSALVTVVWSAIDCVNNDIIAVFADCAVLSSVTISSGVTSIPNYTFAGLTLVSSITIPDTVTKIGNGAFANSTALTSMTIPDTVTKIGNSAFSGCSAMATVTIGKNVETIGKQAFAKCGSLTTVNIPISVKSVGEFAFMECDHDKSDGAVFTITCEAKRDYVTANWDKAWNKVSDVASNTLGYFTVTYAK